MKRNAIFYRFPNGDYGWQAPDRYKSAEEIRTQIVENGWTLATKKEYVQSVYNRVYPEIKRALDEGNIGEVLYFVRWNGNDISMRAFHDITGVKLSPVEKVRIPQLREYFGEKWDAYLAAKKKAAEEKAKERAEEKAKREREHLAYLEEQWGKGEYVRGYDFIILCEAHEVILHPRTKGSIAKNVIGVRKEGSTRIKYGAKNSEGFRDAFWTLKDKLEKKEPEQEADSSLFSQGEVAV